MNEGPNAWIKGKGANPLQAFNDFLKIGGRSCRWWLPQPGQDRLAGGCSYREHGFELDPLQGGEPFCERSVDVSLGTPTGFPPQSLNGCEGWNDDTARAPLFDRGRQ